MLQGTYRAPHVAYVSPYAGPGQAHFPLYAPVVCYTIQHYRYKRKVKKLWSEMSDLQVVMQLGGFAVPGQQEVE